MVGPRQPFRSRNQGITHRARGSKKEDRPPIAGVLNNRLKKGMKLQIDATVLYHREHKARIIDVDLKRDSPYNTYMHMGLPPARTDCQPESALCWRRFTPRTMVSVLRSAASRLPSLQQHSLSTEASVKVKPSRVESIRQGGRPSEGSRVQVRDRTRNAGGTPTPSNSSESDVRPGEVTQAEDTGSAAEPQHSDMGGQVDPDSQQHDNHPVRPGMAGFCPHHVVESVTDVSPLHLRAREFAV